MNWHNEISKRHEFTARFIGAGKKNMLLRDIISCADGSTFRDHMLIPYTKRFRKHDLQCGDILTLRGKVNRYFKKEAGKEDEPRHPDILIDQLELTNIKIIDIERHI